MVPDASLAAEPEAAVDRDRRRSRPVACAIDRRYEPWHYRYVGRDVAAKIHDSALTIREYLWANYTQVDPACVAVPPPTLATPGVP